MKCFIWTEVDELTNRWHSGGGLIVIHETVEQARQLAVENNVKFDNTSMEPDMVYNLEGVVQPDIYIFPNAGCC